MQSLHKNQEETCEVVSINLFAFLVFNADKISINFRIFVVKMKVPSKTEFSFLLVKYRLRIQI
jgi:hypothetical protein